MQPRVVRVQVDLLDQEQRGRRVVVGARQALHCRQAFGFGQDAHGLLELFGEHIDTVAERAVTLGGFAMGTVRCAAANSELEEFPLEPGALEYVKALAKRYAQAANSIRESIDETADLGDADTADLFTAISRDLDKSVWFLEAHFRA